MKRETTITGHILGTSTISPDLETTGSIEIQQPWVVIVWNDPINLMSYVSFVFQKLI